MSRRLVLILSILLLIAMGCNIPAIEDITGPSRPSSLEDVIVEPSIGGPEFTVYLAYIWNLADPVFSITCTHPGTLGGDTETVNVPVNHKDENTKFTFTVTEPGSYNVGCQDSAGNSIESVFTVEARGNSGPAGGGNSSGPKPSDFSKAGLKLIIEQATASISELFPHHCVPEIKIANDGTLSGSCSTTMYGDMELNTGALSGKWNGDTNEVTFQLETNSVYTVILTMNGTTKTGQAITTSIFSGIGNITSDTQATGQADWSTECTSTDVDVITCFNDKASEKANGTVPWLMNLIP